MSGDKTKEKETKKENQDVKQEIIRTRINNILLENKKSYNVNRVKTHEIIDKVDSIFTILCEVILLEGNEYQRALIAETLIENLLVRLLLRGYIVSGVLDHVRIKTVVDPMLRRRITTDQEMIKGSVAQIMDEFKEKQDNKVTDYIR